MVTLLGRRIDPPSVVNPLGGADDAKFFPIPPAIQNLMGVRLTVKDNDFRRRSRFFRFEEATGRKWTETMFLKTQTPLGVPIIEETFILHRPR